MAGGPDRDIILVNLGTTKEPTAPAVREFLDEFLSDPYVIDLPRWIWLPILRGIILRTRPKRVAKLYASIWGSDGSPLDSGTRRMTKALAEMLGDAACVQFAYRYGRPSIPDSLFDLFRRGRDRITLVPLYPQPTGSTTVTIEALVDETLKRARREFSRALDRVEVSAPPPDCPGYIEALKSRCRETFDREGWTPHHLVISFHGIPVRYDKNEKGMYSRACRVTADALLEALDWDPARSTLTYQSTFGPERWLIPATDKTLEELPGRGTESVAVVCPGFLTDGLETLEEIGEQGRETFLEAGGKRYCLVPAVEEHPAMIRSLAHAAGFHRSESSARRSSANSSAGTPSSGS